MFKRLQQLIALLRAPKEPPVHETMEFAIVWVEVDEEKPVSGVPCCDYNGEL